MDKDTEVTEEVTEEVKEVKSYHGYGVSPEHETLIGIYQSTYSTHYDTKRIADFIDRVDWYLELLYYGIVGALIGWAMVQIFKLLKIW